jgi:hypothetical protein
VYRESQGARAEELQKRPSRVPPELESRILAVEERRFEDEQPERIHRKELAVERKARRGAAAVHEEQRPAPAAFREETGERLFEVALG